MEKILVVLRGIPGSGKSTFAKTLGGSHFEADMYFIDSNGNYNFDSSKIKDAHEWCKNSVMSEMESGNPKIVVSNTFTRMWEMDQYFKLAEEFGYSVFSLIVENRHGNKNVHGAPDVTVEAMRDRFEISL